MKAVCLFSGGLDSQLAISLIKQQGIDIEGINFKSPFFGGDAQLSEFAQELGIRVTTLEISEEYLEILKNPRYGYGKNMNPCIDCHGFMIRKAGEYMKEIGASFVVTGEVLGQRPMSQNKSSLNIVEKISGLRGLIVRPLSAQLLKPTIPETEGWIDRDKLLDISGRSRSRQMELAQQWGITEYPSPAGGCLLTTENFSRRLRVLMELKPHFNSLEVEILKYGRHFVMDQRALLVIGRNASENAMLIDLAEPDDYIVKVATHPGPASLLRSFGDIGEDDILWAAKLTARYSDAADLETASVKVFHPGEDPTILSVTPWPKDQTPETV